MSRVWFSQPLETAAAFWRLLRRDGVTLGFTTHDRDLWFDGVVHGAAPGMVPSSIRLSPGFEADSAEVEGALTHDSIGTADLSAGRFDGARVLVGVVDWTSLERRVLYRGSIGSVLEESGRFTAQLQSRKAELALDPVPRTSPGCRARFAGPGCTLPAIRFTHEARVEAVDLETNSITFAAGPAAADLVFGQVRWIDGPHAGRTMGGITALAGALVLDEPLDPALAAGARALVREGCDHRLATCSARFANAINFQGEPFLPGNDQIYRYPPPPQ